MEPYVIALLIFIILAYGVWGFALKFAVDKIGMWSAIAVGFATSIVIGAAIVAYAFSRGGGLPINATSIGLSLAVVFATLAILATYILLEKNYVSIIMPIIELYLVVVVLLGVFVLKEQLTIMQIAGIILAIIAAVLLSI